MKKNMTRLLALLLAMLMVFALAACEGSGGGDGGDNGGSGKNSNRVTPVVKSPKSDPSGYLAMALENTYRELGERYSGSPLAAILGVLDSSGKISLSGEIEEANMDLSDLSIQYDLDAKSFLATADVVAQGIELSGGLCFSKDFVGVSFPLLMGNDDYYGIKPQDLGRQLRNSIFWEAMEGEVSEEDIQMIDDLLDILWDAELFDYDKLVSESQNIAMDYIKGLDVDYDEDTVEVDGEDMDGYVFTATITADDLLDMMDQIYDVILDMPMWDTLIDIAALGGEQVTKRDLQDMMDETMDELRTQMDDIAMEMEVTYYVADSKVVRTESAASTDGQDATEFVFNFFDDGAVTVSATVDGEEIELSSEVESKRGSYVHTLKLTIEGETATITAEWDGDELTLEADIPYEDPMSITCGLSTSKKGFTVEDLRVEYDGADVRIPLTLEYTAGGSVSTPRNTNNLLTLDEDELRELILGMQDILENGDFDW